MKAMLIKIGIQIFLNWLRKEQKDTPDNPTSQLVIGLLNADTVDDIIDVIEDKTTEVAIAQIVADAAKEPAGNLFGAVFGWMFK